VIPLRHGLAVCPVAPEAPRIPWPVLRAAAPPQILAGPVPREAPEPLDLPAPAERAPLWGVRPPLRPGCDPSGLFDASTKVREAARAAVEETILALRGSGTRRIVLDLRWPEAGAGAAASGVPPSGLEDATLRFCRELHGLSRRHPGLRFEMLPHPREGPGRRECSWILDDFPLVGLVLRSADLLGGGMDGEGPEAWWEGADGRIRAVLLGDRDALGRRDLLLGTGNSDLRPLRHLLGREVARFLLVTGTEPLSWIAAADDHAALVLGAPPGLQA
jgi:hypothetical protein